MSLTHDREGRRMDHNPVKKSHPDYYCEIHKYNPLPGSGMAFCPECEGLLLEKVGGVSYVEGVEVDTGEFNEPTTSAKKMPRHQEGRTNEEPPSTDSEAHDAPTED